VDPIKQAINLMRGSEAAADASLDPSQSSLARVAREVRLNAEQLKASRIVAFASSNPYGRSYDMLRTQVLQEMDKRGWQFLAITSPTPACGKTVTACNLALSVGRLPERNVLLVDLDLHKPSVASYLGLPSEGGVIDLLEGRKTLMSTLVQARFGPNQISVMPGSVVASGPAEWMASQRMTALLQTIRRDFRASTVIFDLSPMLLGDDVISILPQMDAVLLVAGVGTTTKTEIKECQKHLKRTPVIRVVVNKALETAGSYYGYYGPNDARSQLNAAAKR
jgi:protein-tyrosine kinase